MDVFFLGFSRLWFDYLVQILPLDASPHPPERTYSLSPDSSESVLFVDDLKKVPAIESAWLESASHILLLHHPGESAPDLPDWLNHFSSKVTLVRLDSSLGPPIETSLPVKSLSCGVSVEGAFRNRAYQASEHVTVGFVSYSAESPLSSLSHPILRPKIVHLSAETSLDLLIKEINSCDVIVEDLPPGKGYPGLVSWLALAQGRAVVADLSALKRAPLPASEQLLPLLDARPETLVSTLESLVKDPRTLRDLHRRGIEFARSYRRLEQSKLQMERLLR